MVKLSRKDVDKLRNEHGLSVRALKPYDCQVQRFVHQLGNKFVVVINPADGPLDDSEIEWYLN